MSFEKAYEEFRIYAKKRHKKQGFDTITNNFNVHVLPYFKGMHVNDLTVKDFIFWQNDILDKNFSNSYNKSLYVAFNDFMKFCVLNSYVNVNYLSVLGTFKTKVEFKSYNIYNYFEFLNFRKGLTDKIYRYFFDLLFFYGLRSGEAMALKFSDLQHGVLHIGSSIERGGNRIISSPKTSNSNRTLKLNIFMRLELFILKCYYQKKFGVIAYDYFIFGGKKPLSPTTIKRRKHNACIVRKIREIKIHEFRHSCATRWIKKGISMDRVSKMLGHSSISITMDIYVHNEKREFSSLLSRLNFFDTITNNFKKILTFIITRFV